MAIANFSDIDVIQLIQTEYPVNVLYPHDDKAGLENQYNVHYIDGNMANNQHDQCSRNEHGQ